MPSNPSGFRKRAAFMATSSSFVASTRTTNGYARIRQLPSGMSGTARSGVVVAGSAELFERVGEHLRLFVGQPGVAVDDRVLAGRHRTVLDDLDRVVQLLAVERPL